MSEDSGNLRVVYAITGEDGRREVFDLDIDLPAVELKPPAEADLPDWTRLEFCQCRNCPLDPADHPRCPVAVRLVNYGARLGNLVSYSAARVEVEMEGRTISADATAQQALRSVLGLVMAASGCPHMEFFKPLARYHEPLASLDLTILRAVAFYLIGQYMKGGGQSDWDTELNGLKEIYHRAQGVNNDLAERLRRAQVFDELNWLVELDTFATLVPMSIEGSLAGTRPLFVRDDAD